VIILPAIDLKGGQCVRLRQGKAEDVTVYSSDPVAQAETWLSQGAEQLHVVDLDGAFQGEPRHTDVIGRIVSAIGIPVEVGGGLRTDAHIEALLKAGAARAIVGTRALENVEALAALVRRFGEKIAVGIDARDGFVQVKGWVETTPPAPWTWPGASLPSACGRSSIPTRRPTACWADPISMRCAGCARR
jgi:phosphoribosylformimino-5-aminoimidazole carboxamide ribotide isomerase